MPALRRPPRAVLANAVRALSMDAVQRAGSGHPGAPLGMADIAEVLWNDFLRHNPGDAEWPGRDRFVLSNGHGSMLLYSLLHLSGYDLPLEELRNFRQLGSMTPGHPERGEAPGVETTTGPLGQGLGNAVGMALAEKALAARYNRKGHAVIDHFTYAFLGDGCLMEGISHEACSLAGTLGLGKLIAFYDDNGISIDGEVRGWFTDDTPARFSAYGWHVIAPVDGHNPKAVAAAIEKARRETRRPTLLCCRTVIGKGAPGKEGTAACHGSPLGDDEVAAARERLGWRHPPFEVPDEIYAAWDAREKGAAAQREWEAGIAAYAEAHPELARELRRRLAGELPEDFLEVADEWIARCHKETLQSGGGQQGERTGADASADDGASGGASVGKDKLATRKASLQCLNALGPALPELIGGSADLTDSNLTLWNGSRPITAQDAAGNYLYFGVREFGMSAILNGLALHGGFIPYGATFLTFMDYGRNAVRMAALMKLPSIFVYTHDSIGLGEDGPTHQPIEHLATLRATPNLQTWRPCDAVETAAAWKAALLRREGPTALVLSRQGLAAIAREDGQVGLIERGGYILWEAGAGGEAGPGPAATAANETGGAAMRSGGGAADAAKRGAGENPPNVILIATGSEVQPTLEAAQILAKQGTRARVVSMPCAEVFDAQDAEYRAEVLPPNVLKVAVEAAHADYWRKYTGLDGGIIGMRGFGASAPGGKLMEHFGFTAEKIAAAVIRELP